MDEVSNLKTKIRQEVLDKRRSLTTGDMKSRSNVICQQLIGLEQFQQSTTILIYVAMPGEVQTGNLFQTGLEQGKLMAVPIVQKDGNPLLLSVLSDRHVTELFFNKTNGNYKKNWRKTGFGILEPSNETIEPIDVSKIDLIVVPGLGFDRTGMRLGFGAGHYDRLLSERRETTIAISVAFDFQIFSEIPYCDHDQRVDMIITESEVIKP